MALTLISCATSELTTDTSPPEPTHNLQTITPAEENDQQDSNGSETLDEQIEGRITIVAQAPSVDPIFRNPLQTMAKYGEEKINIRYWPLIVFNREETHSILEEITGNTEVKVFIANPLVPIVWSDGTTFKELREKREDIFIVYCLHRMWLSDEKLPDLAGVADLILVLDDIGIGPAAVRQAYKMGAETFVHYSRTHSMTDIDFARLELIEKECAILGISFVEIIVPDWVYAGGYEVLKFFREDIPRVVQKYGKNTAFFAREPIVMAEAISKGAIFPHPADFFFSPFNNLLYMMDLRSLDDDDFSELNSRANEAIEWTRNFLAERDMLGRVSNWPVPYPFMFTYTAAEYAIKWMNGEVSRERIDVDVLRHLMKDYAGVEVFLTPFTDANTGRTYDNILLVRMDYIIY